MSLVKKKYKLNMMILSQYKTQYYIMDIEYIHLINYL